MFRLNLESGLWYLSTAVIAAVGLYALHGYFSGSIDGFAAFVVVLVTVATFGFVLGIAAYLGGQRKAGWAPERESERRRAKGPEVPRAQSVITGHWQAPTEYRRHRSVLAAVVAGGFLMIPFSPVLGLVLVSVGAVIYLVLKAVETLE